ncbi:uncharacterized protein LOC105382868 isoform X4 [Plutella xylostella]|uniref:uncharacterized protein LOC105382868 isoform X4 n=1 Tax=Plutella xylostella TaxID=51655 RepID=UPI002032EB44|nr:uncharacterized protein LOC105382868 isoform X4 [Plutella xylostella]
MGQCVSRGHPGSYAFSRHYDSASLGSLSSGPHRHTWGGHSGSKGAKKREKSAPGNGNGNGKPSRGVATSFGFRRRPASSSRADDNARRRKPGDNNGNGGSTEDLRVEEILSGRSTPLARPRKEAAAQQLRTNRQPTISKTAKVGDVNCAAEQAFGVSPKDKDSTINNNALDKKGSNPYNSQLVSHPTQVTSAGQTTIVGHAGVPKSVTKQTVILTYQPQQLLQESRRPPAPRSASATRAPDGPRAPGKYTFQTNQLPRPQYPSVKNVDSKTAKQVANSSRKIATSTDGWREGASSTVSTDSGVWTGGEGGSPTARRRPRNLEMVMKGAHSFHLRELNMDDLDILDENVVTGHTVIPLPKMPSLFDGNPSPDFEVPAPTYNPPSPIMTKPMAPIATAEVTSSPMSTLERYRTRTRPSRIQPMLDSKEEEKFVFDRAEPESFAKQELFPKPSSRAVSPPTVGSSKESSPSCKSEGSSFGNSTTGTWQNHAAGEAMATRSQDDVSLALSVSSCEDDRSKQELKEYVKLEVEVPKKTIVIVDEPPAPHPLLMKSINLSQHESSRGSLMGSMTSSNYSTTSTCTNQSLEHNLTLTLEESKFDISALETSTHSLLDDETSPADSLISSTSTTDSNNDLQIERDVTSITSSAYQTANTNTKTKSPVPIEEEDGVDGEAFLREKEDIVVQTGEAFKNSPESPGTPTHASGSLSLSDGRDFFDDEIADQPALLFRKNNEGSPSLKTVESEASKQLRKSRERINASHANSPQVQRNRKVGMRTGGAERTPSLDTLSSLASDDLMMNDDLARSITSLQSVDDYIERLDSSLRSGLNSLDERQLHQELSSQSAVRQWSQLLEQSSRLDLQLAAMAGSTTHSLTASTTSLSNIGASLPVRTARLLQRSRAQTPSDAGVSDGSASPAPANILQDVVDIKTLLLQLKRVLQEPGDELHSMSSETLDPLLTVCAESPARANGRPPPALRADACAEMRRQILYLQSQLEERDRLVKVLQSQMHKMAETHDARPDDTCTVATQTDRLRPPMSTALTNSENSGLVSWNEQPNARKLQTYSEAQKTKSRVTNGIPVKCTCGAGRRNGLSGDDLDKKDTLLKPTSRVGSKYIQAISTENRRYIKRDSSVGEKTIPRSYMYSTRSKSIENFHNQVFSTRETNNFSKNVLIEESNVMKHHTSYGDLYNGRISSKESVNGNRHSPSLNGQSTDTDYSSDGGYKSLPSSINYTGHSPPKKTSGIPRRSLEQKFLTTKHVKASAI